ncbi:unnamed protein product [Rotaria sp. Silwood1]|nr:unnamed protein product [Rotaria sp. Silwood1]
MFLEDVHWLQDASQMQNGNIIIADANNSRIIEIDPILNTVTITTALNKAEQVLGRKFVVTQQQQQLMARERKQGEFETSNKPI